MCYHRVSVTKRVTDIMLLALGSQLNGPEIDPVTHTNLVSVKVGPQINEDFH